MLGAFRKILVLMLAVALALAGSAGSMAGMAAGSHSQSSMSASLAAQDDDEHRQARKGDNAAIVDVSVGTSAGAADLDGVGAESSCCVMCQTALDMSFPAIVPTCLGSLLTPWAQKAVRAGLSDPLERPPRVS
jgi:hypothetical protein